MNTKSMGSIAGLIFLIAMVGGFFWLWTQSKIVNPSPPISDDLQLVEIESVKKDAEDVLNALVKNSDIPIPTPLEKMGKANPFTAN